MIMTYDNKDYKVCLEDDGTLDTVISVNGYDIRFNSEDVRDENGAVCEDTLYAAIEAYLEEMETI